MFEAVPGPDLVPYDGSFRVARASTKPPQDAPGKTEHKKRLKQQIEQLREQQRMLYAHDRYAVLLVFQAMDAGGKDSTIRAVMSGVNPAGCQVFSFKRPTPQELDHDFLWRTARCLPERGRIGIFNRSYYEEVLVVKVHPQILETQKLPGPADLDSIWSERYESIREHEKHLARNGTVFLKFWLNVSRSEQRRRFLARIEEPEKNWKFSPADLKERELWDEYMSAYESALNETSRPWAPWYVIPADDKPHMRLCVAEIIVDSLKQLGLNYPEVSDAQRAEFAEMGRRLRKSRA